MKKFLAVSLLAVAAPSSLWALTVGTIGTLGTGTTLAVNTSLTGASSEHVDPCACPTTGCTGSNASCSWTDPTVTQGQTSIKAAHFMELQNAVADKFGNCGLTVPAWTNTIASGSAIKAAAVNEIQTQLTSLANQIKTYQTAHSVTPVVTVPSFATISSGGALTAAAVTSLRTSVASVWGASCSAAPCVYSAWTAGACEGVVSGFGSCAGTGENYQSRTVTSGPASCAGASNANLWKCADLCCYIANRGCGNGTSASGGAFNCCAGTTCTLYTFGSGFPNYQCKAAGCDVSGCPAGYHCCGSGACQANGASPTCPL